MLSAEAISKSYGGTRVLASVSLALRPGVTVLLGKNGAGKSTLIRILAALERPDQGVVLRGGRDLRQRAACRDHWRGLGLLPQSFGYPPGMKLKDFLAYAAWMKGNPERRLDALVARALDVTQLSEFGNKHLGALSGGMLRRAGIAQAIVHEPDVLLLDEPTVGLDPEQRTAFHDLVVRIGQEATVLLSTHILEDALAVGQSVVVIDAGRVRFDDQLTVLLPPSGGSDQLGRMREAFLSLTAHPVDTNPASPAGGPGQD